MRQDKYTYLYEAYAGSIAYIEVEGNNNSSIGSAFYIGNGIFITARHVIENKKILSMGTTEKGYGSKVDKKIYHNIPGKLTIKGIYFHPDKTIDVAAIAVEMNKNIPPVLPGIHLNSYLNKELMLKEVLIMGYPPIPCTKEPSLVATTGRIGGIINKYMGDKKNPHFLLSTMARGGFSGGLAVLISEEEGEEVALGMITESLNKNNEPEELGFMAVLTIQPILECLGSNNILPESIKKDWEEHGVSWLKIAEL